MASENTRQYTLSPNDVSRLLDACIPNHLKVLLVGPPGVAKTAVVQQSAARLGYRLLVFHPVVDDPTDYKGFPFAVYDETKGQHQAEFLPFGNLRALLEADEPTICFADDLGQAPGAVQAAFMQLLLARELNGITISDHVTFVGATNRRNDRAGVNGILEPVKSRFDTIVEIEPEVASWTRWAADREVREELIGFIQFRPDLLCKFEPTADLINSPVPRTVENVSKLLNANLPEDLEVAAIEGAAGTGFAHEFHSYLKKYRYLPDIDRALQAPEAIEIPVEPDIRYALITAMAHRCDKETFDSVLTVAKRMPVEFAVVAVRVAVNLKPQLRHTATYVRFISDHQDVLI